MNDYNVILSEIYHKIIPKHSCVIDVGAHSGHFTKIFTDIVGENGLVYAYEPNPKVYPWLLDHLSGHPNYSKIRFLNCALSDKVNRNIEFFVAEDRLEESGLRCRSFNGPTKINKVIVNTSTLDNELSLLERKINLIKIDVEGAEFSVLKGGNSIISKHKPIISFEFGLSSFSAYDVNPVDVYKFFYFHNYIIFDLFGSLLSEDQFVKSSIKQEVWDYIAFYKEDVPTINILQN